MISNEVLRLSTVTAVSKFVRITVSFVFFEKYLRNKVISISLIVHEQVMKTLKSLMK